MKRLNDLPRCVGVNLVGGCGPIDVEPPGTTSKVWRSVGRLWHQLGMVGLVAW